MRLIICFWYPSGWRGSGLQKLTLFVQFVVIFLQTTFTCFSCGRDLVGWIYCCLFLFSFFFKITSWRFVSILYVSLFFSLTNFYICGLWWRLDITSVWIQVYLLLHIKQCLWKHCFNAQPYLNFCPPTWKACCHKDFNVMPIVQDPFLICLF